MAEEIRVPLEVREFMPEWVEETWMGDPRGAKRQYRYGSLHVREYGSHYAVHADKHDPRANLAGHLVEDAPEVLAGFACAVLGGIAAYGAPAALRCGRPRPAAALASAAAAGWLGYKAAKKIKKTMRDRREPAREGQRRRRPERGGGRAVGC